MAARFTNTQFGIMKLIILQLLFVHWSKADIKCYECQSINPNNDDSKKLCSSFRQSKEYVKHCHHSTFCMKKSSELELLEGGKIRLEERTCAPQETIGYKLEDHRWKPETVMEAGVYKEGCISDLRGPRASRVEYCYCDSDYCNAGYRLTWAIPSLGIFSITSVVITMLF